MSMIFRRRLSKNTTATTECSFHDSFSSQDSSVSFGVVQVREFERIVGDHPCVSDNGPPLSIGWAYYEDGVETPVDAFEMTHGPYPYRRPYFQALNGTARRVILQEFFDVPGNEIREAQIEVARIKKQRKETIENDGRYTTQGILFERFQDALQSATLRIRNRRRKICSSLSKRR